MDRIKALCFDVDGTLSDTDDLYARKVLRYLPRFLFKDSGHTARRFVMWVEAPGNAMLGFADTLGFDDEMVAVVDWLAARKMNTAPENCLMIGDTTVDMRAGISAGAQVVSVLCGFGEEAELKRMGADLILSDTPKLINVLK